MAPVHPGSPPPRKRMMLSLSGASPGSQSASVETMAIRQQSTLEVLEQSPIQLGRQRRHHSDPGACVLKMQRPCLPAGFIVANQQSSQPAAQAVSTAVHITPEPLHHHGAHTGKNTSKRERRSSGGDVPSTSSGASTAPSFTITVDCRADSTATALWQRMHQLEIRNKELEQQLVERMQAAQISNCSSSGSGSAGGSKQQPLPWLPSHQLDITAAGLSPRAHAALAEPESPVAMEVEPSCSFAAQEQGPAQQPNRTSHPQQQQEASASGLQPQSSTGLLQQQASQGVDSPGPQRLVQTLRQQVKQLQKELQRQKQLNTMLTSDNADLEAVLKETERQRREFAARYAFMTLDTDGDGYVSIEQVLTYDLFSCYAPSVLMAAFSVWRWDSGFPGYLCMDDFVRFVEYAEDRSTRESQRFWFTVMDADGDGRLSWADMKLLYDAAARSCTAGCLLHFEDLMNQIRDMVAQQREPGTGFTAQELWESKLGAGVIGLLTNANNMLLQRSTAEWGRGDFPL